MINNIDDISFVCISNIEEDKVIDMTRTETYETKFESSVISTMKTHS